MEKKERKNKILIQITTGHTISTTFLVTLKKFDFAFAMFHSITTFVSPFYSECVRQGISIRGDVYEKSGLVHSFEWNVFLAGTRRTNFTQRAMSTAELAPWRCSRRIWSAPWWWGRVLREQFVEHDGEADVDEEHQQYHLLTGEPVLERKNAGLRRSNLIRWEHRCRYICYRQSWKIVNDGKKLENINMD